MKELLAKAIRVASFAHESQFDNGEPYVCHSLRIMFLFSDITLKIVAVLHDTIEDTKVRLVDLEKMGFGEEIVEAVDALTIRKDEKYFKYIKRLSKNKIACVVKLKDLEDNMNRNSLETENKELYKRYIKAEKILSKKCFEKVKTED